MIPVKSFIVIVNLLTCLLAQSPIVNLPKGKIQGKTLSSPNEGKRFHAFLGIPYAKPPTGDLRFQAPVEADSWEGIKDATHDSNICYATTYDKPTENEDCLYLNVLTPAVDLSNSSKKLPVMFSIYGGAFRSGADTYGRGGPEWFLEQDIIVVSFNYRIGAFGFLSTGDLVVPGNAGLKDQNFALKWTYENIHLFGGDRNQITLRGQSAGGASVTFHLLSKQSQGLYRAAVSESGSAICEWAYIANPKNYVAQLAKAVNNGVAYPSSNSKDLLEFLQKADAKLLDTVTSKMTLTLPVIEPEHEGAFITEPMYETLAGGKSAKVPVFMGINSEEDLVMAKDISTLKVKAASYDANPQQLIPRDLTNLSRENKTIVANIIKKAYVGDSTFANNLGKVVVYNSDVIFNKANIRFGHLQSGFSDVYFYQFSYKGKMGLNDYHIEGADNVAHGEEGHYMGVIRAGSYDNTKFQNFPESDVTTHYRLIQVFSNFIKYLNPTPDPSSELLQNLTWPKVTPDNFKYVNINTSLTIEDTPKREHYTMWKNLYETYGTRPFVTF